MPDTQPVTPSSSVALDGNTAAPASVNKPVQPTGPPKPNEPTVEQQLQAIATERKRVRELEPEAKLAKAFKENLKKGDLEAAIKSLGVEDFDDFYNKLTDQIVGREKASKDPEQIANALFDKKMKEWQDSQTAAAEAKTASKFISDASDLLASSRGKFAAMEVELLKGTIERTDIYGISQKLREAGKPHDMEATLAFIDGHFKTLQGGSGVSAVAAPEALGAAGGPAGATTQSGTPPGAKVPVAAAPPATLSSNTPVRPDESDDDLSIDERLARRKAKARKTAA